MVNQMEGHNVEMRRMIAAERRSFQEERRVFAQNWGYRRMLYNLGCALLVLILTLGVLSIAYKGEFNNIQQQHLSQRLVSWYMHCYIFL